MTTANGQLKAFVERIERVESDIKDMNDDKRDIYQEAKSSGFDVKALKIVIGKRRKDPSELSELEALVETYECALGTPVATRARTNEPQTSFGIPVKPSPDTAGAMDGDNLDIPPFLDAKKRASA